MTDLFLLALVLTTWGWALLTAAYEIVLRENRMADIEEIEFK
jgi:hypothetical protein